MKLSPFPWAPPRGFPSAAVSANKVRERYTDRRADSQAHLQVGTRTHSRRARQTHTSRAGEKKNYLGESINYG